MDTAKPCDALHDRLQFVSVLFFTESFDSAL